MRILFLEDDAIQLELAGSWLRDRGHFVVPVASGKAALKALERDSFDLAIFDWMVPDPSGHELLRWLRKRGKAVPVIFATARSDERDVATMLDLGADDYVVKPLRRLEFLARVDAVARRAGLGATELVEPYQVGPYLVDPGRRSIALRGAVVRMTPRMTEVALLIFRRRGELVSRAQLYDEVWGRPEPPNSRSVDTHVSRVRQALELDGRHGWRLACVYHHGYRLENASAEQAARDTKNAAR
jgi:DNA-binding response OmpR family regulator